jgi:FlaG/FlaF family flagellin (archaellin)
LIMMIITKRKGISTFIATLLLMVLAVAAGVVIYAYTMGYLGSFSTPTTMGAISVDTWALDTTTNGLQAYIRNIGHSTFSLDTVYVNGIQVTGVTMTDISEGKVGTFTIGKGGGAGQVNWLPATTYIVKVVGKDNTQLSFQVKG